MSRAPTVIETPDQAIVRVADLSATATLSFRYEPDAVTCQAIAAELDATRLSKVRLTGHLAPAGRKGWHLDATLGATAVQPCAITLAPVTTRIDQPVSRHFVDAEIPDDYEAGSEIEMDADTDREVLGTTIDLHAVLIESLSLALPDFPRAGDATLEQAQFAGPGVAPMTDDDAKPFAALAKLRQEQTK